MRIRRKIGSLIPFLAVLIVLPVGAAGPRSATEGLAWAYPRGTRTAYVPLPPRAVVRIPGSARSFTGAQVTEDYAPIDWFPEAHPKTPEIVARDQKRR